ncbi:hypothetical protein [Oceanibium sediminis]|uniref:hypothetical protein n=1 Tax=Oceanibium sediminis TaxID=2026339 RepID=UPI00130037AE|nr:hypothetical protein [Oceanibium sediminis]
MIQGTQPGRYALKLQTPVARRLAVAAVYVEHFTGTRPGRHKPDDFFTLIRAKQEDKTA